MAPRLVSIQVGRPRQMGTAGAADPFDCPWSSAMFKDTVAGPVWLATGNLAGDQQADLSVHGGTEKAVLAYAAAHYPLWRNELGIGSLSAGAFGENFTLEGWDENTVAIGDTFRVGDAEIQVSQPRMPCWKLAFKWRRPDLPARVVETGRSGWYFRVLREGRVEAGSALDLLQRPCPQWTVVRVSELAYDAVSDRASALELAACEWLTQGWRKRLAQVAAAP